MEIRSRLPEHPIPEGVRRAVQMGRLVVDGLVEQASAFSPADLAGLPRAELTEPFICEEGWQVPRLTWCGVRLLDVLAIAQPRAEAHWLRVSAGEYAVPLSLEEAGQAILADELNGQPLSLSHGGPWRLVMSGAACFSSVKWVDHLELAAEPGEASGEAIARARLAT